MFSGAQRTAMHGVSLSRIICDNTHIRLVPPDPFTRTLHTEDLLPCAHPLIPQLNLSAWREPDTGHLSLTENDKKSMEMYSLKDIDFITFSERNGCEKVIIRHDVHLN